MKSTISPSLTTPEQIRRSPLPHPVPLRLSSADKAANGHIFLSIGTLTGNEFRVKCALTDTVNALKIRISEAHGIAPESQRLVFREKELKNGHLALRDLGVLEESRLQLVLNLVGGPGSPSKLKKVSRDTDNIVVLLCKDHDDLYYLQVDTLSGKVSDIRPKRLTKLSSTGSLTPSLNDILNFDLDNIDALEAELRELALSEFENIDVEERIESCDDAQSSESVLSDFRTRESTMESSFSFNDDFDDSDCDDFLMSRLYSSERKLGESDEIFTLSGSRAQSAKSSRKSLSSTASSKRRPLTAISVMRVTTPSEVIILPIRPASAKAEAPIPPKTPQFQKPAVYSRKGSLKSLRSPIKERSITPANSSRLGSPLLHFSSSTPAGKRVKGSQCGHCSRKLTPGGTFKCRCEGLYCGQHRIMEAHLCSSLKLIKKSEREKLATKIMAEGMSSRQRDANKYNS